MIVAASKVRKVRFYMRLCFSASFLPLAPFYQNRMNHQFPWAFRPFPGRKITPTRRHASSLERCCSSMGGFPQTAWFRAPSATSRATPFPQARAIERRRWKIWSSPRPHPHQPRLGQIAILGRPGGHAGGAGDCPITNPDEMGMTADQVQKGSRTSKATPRSLPPLSATAPLPSIESPRQLPASSAPSFREIPPTTAIRRR